MFNLEVKYLNIIEALPTSTHIFKILQKIFLKFSKIEFFEFWFLKNVARKINSFSQQREIRLKLGNGCINQRNNDTEISSL